MDIIETLEDMLPSGSGIDCDWEIEADEDGFYDCSNSYHIMGDGSGGYIGWVDFVLSIDLDNPMEFEVELKNDDLTEEEFHFVYDDLAEYLEDLFSVCLMTNKKQIKQALFSQKDFVKKSRMDSGLLNAVVEQSGGWEDFRESAPDVVENGIDGGFGGWIYYSETINFYRSNHEKIRTQLYGDAEQLDLYVVEYIKSFQCLKGLEPTENEIVGAMLCCADPRDNHLPKFLEIEAELTDGIIRIIQNALAWYAAETACRSYMEQLGEIK